MRACSAHAKLCVLACVAAWPARHVARVLLQALLRGCGAPLHACVACMRARVQRELTCATRLCTASALRACACATELSTWQLQWQPSVPLLALGLTGCLLRQHSQPANKSRDLRAPATQHHQETGLLIASRDRPGSAKAA